MELFYFCDDARGGDAVDGCCASFAFVAATLLGPERVREPGRGADRDRAALLRCDRLGARLRLSDPPQPHSLARPWVSGAGVRARRLRLHADRAAHRGAVPPPVVAGPARRSGCSRTSSSTESRSRWSPRACCGRGAPLIAEIAVDLGALARNADALARLVAPARLAAVIKANAYGHGLVPVARALAPHAARLCVYELEEAVALRDAGIDAPIHVLGPIPATDLDAAHAANVQLTLWDHDLYARQVASVARRRRRNFAVHAKIDTGVVRLGLTVDEAPAVLERYAATPEYDLVGAFTHLAAAEELDSTFTLEQLARFLLATQTLDASVERHAAATAAAILWPETRLDAVRCGIGLYGIWPSDEAETLMRERGLVLEPALSWRRASSRCTTSRPDTTVGYGRTWRAARRSTIATLPIGYAEGLPRSAGNAAQALVRGTRVPLIGRVCMDMAFLDVTDVAGVAVGDTVTLIGADGDERITAEELAPLAGRSATRSSRGLPAHVPRTLRRYAGSCSHALTFATLRDHPRRAAGAAARARRGRRRARAAAGARARQRAGRRRRLRRPRAHDHRAARRARRDDLRARRGSHRRTAARTRRCASSRTRSAWRRVPSAHANRRARRPRRRVERPVHATAPSHAPPARPTPTTYAIALTPASGSTVHDPYPAITARFAGATSIDPRSLRVSLDGRDVSAEAAVVGDEVLLTPRRAFAPGTHYRHGRRARRRTATPLAQQWSFADDFAFAAVPRADAVSDQRDLDRPLDRAGHERVRRLRAKARRG